MADKRISQLTELLVPSVQDLLVIVDISSNETKRITYSTLFDSLSAVSSVYARTGDVVAVDGDYNATQITNTPAGNIVAITVQDALNELDTEKASSGANSDITSLSGLTTPLSISQGGTGQNTQQTAVDALTNVSGATNEYVLTKDTASGNAIWKQTIADVVTSVFGRIGVVVATAGDYIASQITNTPTGNIAATNMQDAINELDSEKASLELAIAYAVAL